LPYQGSALPTELHGHSCTAQPEQSIAQKTFVKKTRRLDPSRMFFWSGKRDSNPRPRAWKARALPTELFPLSPSSSLSYWWRGEDSNLRRHKPADLQSAPFGHSGTSPQLNKSHQQAKPMASRPSRWPELNWQPTDYKSVALPLSYIGQELNWYFYAACTNLSTNFSAQPD